MLDKKLLGKHITKLRKEQNMTQKDLASRLHMSFQAVSKWERGVSLPDVEILSLLGRVLGTSLWSLLYQSNSTMTINQLVDDLNINKITKANYNNIAVLLQSELLNDDFLSRIHVKEVLETLNYIRKHRMQYTEFKTIKLAHEIVKVYTRFLDDSFLVFKKEEVNKMKLLTLVGNIDYDGIIMNKFITKKLERRTNTVIAVYNMKHNKEHIYVSCTQDLIQKGFSAYFICQFIVTSLTSPQCYGKGGGGEQHRASFEFRNDCLSPNVEQESIRLLKEYMRAYKDFKISITNQ